MAVACVAIALAIGCNAITGTDKYDVVDCPAGNCASLADGGGANGDGSTNADGGSPAEGGADAGPDVPSCAPGTALLVLTVSGAAGTVNSNPSGLSVASGNTGSACLRTGTVELRTNQGDASWSGVSCKDGQSGRDRCELQLGAAGATVAAVLN
jgi:hypothetical protein